MNVSVPQAWVVDDEAVNRALVCAFLQRLGWASRAFDSAAAVLAAADEGLPALLIIDIRMPQMSGTELMTALRSRAGMSLPRFVAYTAHCFNGEIQALLQAGFDHVLIKPIAYRQMEEVVRDVDLDPTS